VAPLPTMLGAVRRARIAGLTLLAMAVGSVALTAQGPRLSFAVGATGVRVQSLAPTGVVSELSGTTLGASGGIALGRVALDIGYWQGRVAPVGTGGAGVRPPARDYTEGTVLLGVQPSGWLRVRASVQARTYVTPAGTERWRSMTRSLKGGGVRRETVDQLSLAIGFGAR